MDRANPKKPIPQIEMDQENYDRVNKMADELVKMVYYDRRDGDAICKIKMMAMKMAQLRIWVDHFEVKGIPCTAQHLIPGMIQAETLVFSVFKEIHKEENGNSHSEYCKS